MRTFAIGDIHGCRKALETLVSAVEPQADDLFVFLGDYVNRGPDSRGVIEFLLRFREGQRCVFLRGNHEVMTLDGRKERMKAASLSVVGGRDSLRSYGYDGRGDWWTFIPETHWKFMENTGRFLEDERHIFVHGYLEADMGLVEQRDDIFWERFESIRPHRSGKKVIVGHTPSRDGQIRDVGYAACVDTGCVMGGWLTALDVNSGRVWQANQKGEARTGVCPGWA